MRSFHAISLRLPGPLAVLLVVLAGLTAPAKAEPASPGPSIEEATRRYEELVVHNIRQQRIGRYAVVDLDLPEDFLRRLADIETRYSFHLGHQNVYRDVEDDRAPWTPDRSDASSDWIRLRTTRPSDATLAYREAFPADRPGLRGFRAPVLEHADERWPGDLPADESEPVLAAEKIVAKRLTSDGLLATLAHVLQTLGPDAFVAVDEVDLQTLRLTGFPVDLLRHFRLAGDDRRPARGVETVARQLAGGEPIAAVLKGLQAVAFAFVVTRPGFLAASESGEHDIDMLRLQMARGDYWRGPGGGDGVDIARQLAQGLPDASLLVSVSQADADTFVETAKRWPHARDGRLTVAVEPLAVTQWARDNGMAGRLASGDGGPAVPATLMPRYASKRNDASEFIPGDSFVADGLAAAGHAVFQSPLLFQGGNLLVARDPGSGERILAISEAEIYRNGSLGLSGKQVVEAFTAEMGVDRTVVLPAVAFHLDYDVSLRAHEGRLVAFVNDVDAAMRLVLDRGLDALERAELLDADAKRTAREHLRARRDEEFFGAVAPAVWELGSKRNAFPLSFANHFSDGDADSGVGNLQRFLVALDRLFAVTVPEAGQPPIPQTRAYLRSFRRTTDERRDLHAALEAQGWRLAPVPGLPFAERSISYVNGIHARNLYVMPAHGGFYESVDDAAEAALRKILGPEVRILRVLSAESQRRSGAVHCSVAAYPRPEGP